MVHVIALVTFSRNKIVESLFHLLLTDRVNHGAQDTSRRTVRLYI